MTSLEVKIDATHVKVTYDEKKKMHVIKVACLLCNDMVLLSKTEYSVSAGNYKSHISRKHLKKLQGDGTDSKQITL